MSLYDVLNWKVGTRILLNATPEARSRAERELLQALENLR
jgi:hypothetical protein